MGRRQPFSNGSEYEMWQCNNCFKCEKFNDDIHKTCKLEYSLSYATISDWLVDEGVIEITNPWGRCSEFKAI